MIKKAVVLCGGLGTRFLPITKAVPKELLPVIDRPVLDYIIEELIASNIEDIAIVISPQKQAIKQYFAPNKKLEKLLQKGNKTVLLQELQSANKKAKITFIVQHTPNGSGGALLLAKEYVGNEPFCVTLGDDIIESTTPAMQQLIETFELYKIPVLGVKKVPKKMCKHYGIISPIQKIDDCMLCDKIVEKPLASPPSCYASIGRYVFTPEIFARLEQTNYINELPITDAINKLNSFYARKLVGKRYDMGSKKEFVKLVIKKAKKIDV